MSDMMVTPAQLDNAFESILSSLEGECEADVDRAVRKGANECRSALKKGSPKDSGRYAEGWKSKLTSGFGTTEATIYNATKPTLTHLLEFGHEKWLFGRDTGERVPAKPHIEAAYERGVEKLKEELMR